jgi:hypothetical protein
MTERHAVALLAVVAVVVTRRDVGMFRDLWERWPYIVVFGGTILTAFMGLLILLGAASVVYWFATEQAGAGDLRYYALVQFGSLLIVALLVWLYPARYTGQGYLVAALALYALANRLEAADRIIFSAGRYRQRSHTKARRRGRRRRTDRADDRRKDSRPFCANGVRGEPYVRENANLMPPLHKRQTANEARVRRA